MNWNYMCRREQAISHQTCGQCKAANITWCADCGTPLCFTHCVLFHVEGEDCSTDLCSECTTKREEANQSANNNITIVRQTEVTR